MLSQIEGFKHEEIAQQLDISVNTVQNYISTALRKLKVELKDFLPLFIFII
ncbi:MAG: LuxR C-terminal-related transcriptional regulator [Tannerellaceae bacterium]|nr:LuxR C-terminal-related transcriptional regulator [Tannerellaceae bacterium]